LRRIESELYDEYGLSKALNEQEQRILKFCDAMELAIYSVEEADRGDASAAIITGNALRAIEHRAMQDVTPNARRLYDTIRAYWESNLAKRSIFNEWKC
jgi:hypothetical protein